MRAHRIVLASLVLAVLPPVVTASAPMAGAEPPPTRCRGERVTLTGAPGERLEGTDGRDVIATNGAKRVVAGKGDDLICVTTGGRYRGTGAVYAGAGDDRVYAIPARLSSGCCPDVVLGRGSDYFEVSESGEDGFTVDTGNERGGVVDRERDVVRSLGVKGFFDVTSGDGRVFNDVITAAGGLWVRINAVRMTKGAVVRGGDDAFGYGRTLELHRLQRGAWTVDAADGVVRRDGRAVMRFDGGFDTFFLRDGPAVTFLGSPRSEEVHAEHLVRAELGGGNDLLELRGGPRDGDVLLGGAGHDSVTLPEGLGVGNVEMDLDEGRVRYDDATLVLRSFRSMRLGTTGHLGILGRDSELDADRLSVHACGGVSGDLRAGDDRVAVESSSNSVECEDPVQVVLDMGEGDDQFTFRDLGTSGVRGGPGDDDLSGGFADDVDVLMGGPGDDVLRGGDGDDYLVGGHGDDVADGGPADDYCAAETRIGCES